MKKAIALCFLVGVGLALKWTLSGPESRLSDVESNRWQEPISKESAVVSDQESKSKVWNRSSDKGESPQIKATSPIASSEKSQKPTRKSSFVTPKRKDIPEGHIVFENINGFAVTQGDVLLGLVKEGQTSKFAMFKPTDPQLWPSAQIPYVISKDLSNSMKVKEAIEYLNMYTPLRFVPYTGEANAIVFEHREGLCASYLGMQQGPQPIFIHDRCDVPHIIHEIMHALGFVHEQSRTDRDIYVEILWENIAPDKEHNFYKVPDVWVQEYRGGGAFEFDYNSVMLYGPYDFSVRPAQDPTMKSKTSREIKKNLESLSEKDLQRLELLYGD